MSDYSERQLLLLSNLLYLPCSLYELELGDLLDRYRDGNGGFSPESVHDAGVGGGLSDEDVSTLFNQLDNEIQKTPSFGQLSPARRLNGGYVRAVCYTDGKDENPVVVFRGTGGSEQAWRDNFEGGYETDTKMQKLAADFITNECGSYEGITVSGHSKGGNLSQYVAIMCKDNVTRCVSFDGQGFCNEFVESNRERIDEVSGNIKSIVAYNDYVNILLTPVAGTIMYACNGSSIVDAHSSLSLLMSNEYDSEGNFISQREQSIEMKMLKKATDGIVKIIDGGDSVDKSMMSYVTGTAISSALCMQDSSELSAVAGTVAGGVMAMFTKGLLSFVSETGISSRQQPVSQMVYIKPDKLRLLIKQYQENITLLRSICARVQMSSENSEFNLTSRIYVMNKLETINRKIKKTSQSYEKLETVLEEVIALYEGKEQEIAQLFAR